MKNVIALIINIICFSFILLFESIWLGDFFKGIFISDENWQPSIDSAYAPMPLVVFFILYPIYTVITRFIQLLYKLIRGKLAEYDRLNYASLLISFLVVFIYFGVNNSIDRARELFDKRIMGDISGLRPGMTQIEVDKLISGINFDLMDKNRRSSDVVNAALFHPDLGNNAREQQFRRKYINHMDYWVTYILNLEYDLQRKLKSVTYKKDVFMEDPYTCDIILEIPARKSQKYPYPCPKVKEGTSL
jgi:hypothetical protein